MFEPLLPEDFGAGAVLAFDACTAKPDRVLLETSFIERCTLVMAPGHTEAAAFLEHLDLVGTDLLYSAILELELLDASWAPDRARGRALEPWREVMESTRVHWVGIDDVLDDVPALMERFGLRAAAAVHVATALAAEVDAIVTVDPDFAVVDESLLRLLVDGGSVDRARWHRGVHH